MTHPKDATGVRRAPRTPGFIYGALLMVLLMVLGVIALTARQPPPPSIAEFAPQAVQQIRETQSDQGASFGVGTALGGGGGLGSVAPPDVKLPPVEVARVKKCVGDPPRQIEDPQSPPCVPYWEGDNGGATYQGVTRNEIRLALPMGHNPNNYPKIARILQNFFNKRFQFYGRQVTIHNAGGGAQCPDFKASAAALDASGYFGILDNNSVAASCLHAEAARLGMMSVNTQILFTEQQMRQLRPHLWQYMMDYDSIIDLLGEMVCARLAGGNAIYSPDPLTKITKRKYGIIIQEQNADTQYEIEGLKRALAKCGFTDVPSARQTWNPDGQENLRQSESAMLRMRSEQVTSIICLCLIFLEFFLGSYANAQGYFPEWILTSYGANDYSLTLKALGFPNAEQRQSIHGLSVQPPQHNYQNEPFWWAAREVDPTFRPEEAGTLFSAYQSMLLMASGIQMAGPNLTPETFERGLHRAVFPNPDHPLRQGKVGFRDGDHSMTEDGVEFWWSENDRTPGTTAGQEETGTLCYVEMAMRRERGRWPTQKDPFFVRPCFPGA